MATNEAVLSFRSRVATEASTRSPRAPDWQECFGGLLITGWAYMWREDRPISTCDRLRLLHGLQAGELPARRDPELGEDVSEVSLGRARGDEQALSDLSVGHPLSSQEGHIVLGPGQAGPAGCRSP